VASATSLARHPGIPAVGERRQDAGEAVAQVERDAELAAGGVLLQVRRGGELA
jgi:hypothetical protein